METFIRFYDLIPQKVCDSVIDLHVSNPNSGSGRLAGAVIPEYKRSTDSGYANDSTLPQPIFQCLNLVADCLTRYLREFPDANNVDPFQIVEGVNVQHYKPNEGFYLRHCERAGTQTMKRHLVFMVYLNTVTDGGGTEFPNQEMILNAVAGRVVIWPSDWTHSHYGIVSPSQEKFILTGWYSYL